MMFRSYGANSNASRSSFSTFVEEMGQLIRSFAVGRLESNSTYYFRLYVIGVNFTAVSSNVVSATTKPLRARFHLTNYIDKTTGAPGTVVTLTFDSAKGIITADHVVKLGEKVVTLTILGNYSASFVVPTFENILGPKSLSVQSPTKLVDVRQQAFTVSL
jgi:hypothetical protein